MLSFFDIPSRSFLQWQALPKNLTALLLHNVILPAAPLPQGLVDLYLHPIPSELLPDLVNLQQLTFLYVRVEMDDPDVTIGDDHPVLQLTQLRSLDVNAIRYPSPEKVRQLLLSPCLLSHVSQPSLLRRCLCRSHLPSQICNS